MAIIKLKDLLMEGAKENAALDYLRNLIKKSPYEGKVFLLFFFAFLKNL